MKRDKLKLPITVLLGFKVLCLHFVLLYFFIFLKESKFYFPLPRNNESVHSMIAVSMRK